MVIRRRYWIWMLLCLSAGLLVYGYLQYQRTNQDLRRRKADLTVNAAALVQEFGSNASLADKKYRKSILAVRGIVQMVDTSGNSISITISDSDWPYSIRFSMDGQYPEFSAIRKGMTVSLQGILNGVSKDPTGLLGDEIVFNRGVWIP